MSRSGRNGHRNALQNYQRAVIPRVKVEKYVLDPTHPVGKHKAVVFKSVLGFEQADWELMRDSIVAELPYHEAVPGKTDQYGTRYNVSVSITGPNGCTVDVLTAWIFESGNDYPSFVTAFVK